MCPKNLVKSVRKTQNLLFGIEYVRDHYRVSKKNSEQGVPTTKHCFITKIIYLRDDKFTS